MVGRGVRSGQVGKQVVMAGEAARAESESESGRVNSRAFRDRVRIEERALAERLVEGVDCGQGRERGTQQRPSA